MGSQIPPKAEDVDQQAHEWAVVLEEGTLSEVELRRLEDWLSQHPERVDLLDSVITAREAFNTLRRADIDKALWPHSVSDQPRDAARQGNPWHRRGVWFPVAAACCALVAVIITYTIALAPDNEPIPSPILVDAISYSTDVGETSEILLSDGTKLVLGPASSTNVGFYNTHREVELLSGMAFVDVESDENRPFSVRAGALTATALGTEFEVRHSVTGYQVGVAEGQVLVSYPVTINHMDTGQSASAPLTAGQQVFTSLRSGISDVQQISAADIASWRSGKWVYLDSPISALIDDLNRISTVPISIADPEGKLSDLRIQAVFRGNDVEKHLTSLESILPVVSDTSDPTAIIIRPARSSQH